jgi:hypothetical protein
VWHVTTGNANPNGPTSQIQVAADGAAARALTTQGSNFSPGW